MENQPPQFRHLPRKVHTDLSM